MSAGCLGKAGRCEEELAKPASLFLPPKGSVNLGRPGEGARGAAEARVGPRLSEGTRAALLGGAPPPVSPHLREQLAATFP